MSQLKINILYKFKLGPWGGANQFLKDLRLYFMNLKIYSDNPFKSQVVLFNSNPSKYFFIFFLYIYIIKLIKKNLLLINRIDGPIFFIRDKDLILDQLFHDFNYYVCDGTIYQSIWSKNKNYKLGMKRNSYETCIINSANQNIFYKKQPPRSFSFKNRKLRIICSSWSSNQKKGFNIYKWLDRKLDFSKYEMIFIGKSPIRFTNIVMKSPLDSINLASELRASDIYITASSSDPCSNSLVEAISCGLPIIALNDGGHPEILDNNGELFNSKNEIIEIIEKIRNNYSYYFDRANKFIMKNSGNNYYSFLCNIIDDVNNKQYKPKNYSFTKLCHHLYTYLIFRLNEKFQKE